VLAASLFYLGRYTAWAFRAMFGRVTAGDARTNPDHH